MTDIVFWIVIAALAAALVTIGYFVFATRRIAARAEELVPPSGKFVTIDGKRIHYVDKGQGPPILFLHGLGGTLFNFTWPLFDKMQNGFRLVALDRPGSGYSTRPDGKPASPGEQAQFVLRFMEELNIDKPLVVGHSLGGAIALSMALDHADRISGLALIAPLTRYRDAVPPEFAPLYIENPLIRRIVAHTVAVPRSMKYRDQTLDFVFGPQQPPKGYAVEGGAAAGLRPSHFYATSTDCVSIADHMREQEKRYGEIELPVGIYFGTADRVLDCDEHGRWLVGKMPEMELELAEGIGHMPQYDRGDDVAAFIHRLAARAFVTA